MKQAIITGSTGLIGSVLVRHLISAGVEVLCLGKSELKDSEVLSLFGKKAIYHVCLMKNISNLQKLIKQINFHVGSECVFFHFAWGSETGLTSGSLQDQMENAIASAISVKVAKSLGCSKFVSSGSLEETFIEEFLSKRTQHYESMQTNYGLAKIASRDMCRMTAYLEKIDYVHTRLSAPLSPDLSQKSYIAKTLLTILEGKDYQPPKNKRFFDFISTKEIPLAFELIGKYGKNKSDYFIGTGHPVTLEHYFNYFKRQADGLEHKLVETSVSYDLLKVFNISNLEVDTGFKSQINSLEIVKFRNKK
ncbi:NAD-dependent epimerase/dehydratase family protein [Pseudomonadota bacterium]|nr:NAD-dependent epimerase/dehydratase family protein [Pseudomonadota bacterium]